jgi:hypothetical protein
MSDEYGDIISFGEGGEIEFPFVKFKDFEITLHFRAILIIQFYDADTDKVVSGKLIKPFMINGRLMNAGKLDEYIDKSADKMYRQYIRPLNSKIDVIFKHQIKFDFDSFFKPT